MSVGWSFSSHVRGICDIYRTVDCIHGLAKAVALLQCCAFLCCLWALLLESMALCQLEFGCANSVSQTVSASSQKGLISGQASSSVHTSTRNTNCSNAGQGFDSH